LDLVEVYEKKIFYSIERTLLRLFKCWVYLPPMVFLFVACRVDFLEFMDVDFLDRFLRYFCNLRLIKDNEADKMGNFLE